MFSTMQLGGQTLGQPLHTLGQTGAQALGETPWHDDLLGGTWSWPLSDDDEEARRTSEEIEALLGELIAELEG